MLGGREGMGGGGDASDGGGYAGQSGERRRRRRWPRAAVRRPAARKVAAPSARRPTSTTWTTTSRSRPHRSTGPAQERPAGCEARAFCFLPLSMRADLGAPAGVRAGDRQRREVLTPLATRHLTGQSLPRQYMPWQRLQGFLIQIPRAADAPHGNAGAARPAAAGCSPDRWRGSFRRSRRGSTRPTACSPTTASAC